MLSGQVPGTWDPSSLRAALKTAGYTGDAFRAADGDANVLVASAGSPLLDIAHRLFAAGLPVPHADVEKLLGKAFAPLLELGLLAPQDNERVSSTVRIEPDGDSWFASDHPSRLASSPEHVMGIGRSTKILAALAPSRPGLKVLDLCTGAGWVALQMKRTGCAVTAADISQRALEFARFNARLGGCEGIEFLQGDRLSPVAGRGFDLITANPPFVISPESSFTFRDSGLPGSTFCENLARTLPDHLAADGIALMLLSWFDDGREENASAPLDWTRDAGCNAWLFRTLTQDPAEYARQWLREGCGGRSPAPADLRRWIGYFAELGARRFHTGFMILHRGDGPRWTRSDARRMEHLRMDAGRDIRAVVDGESWLARRAADAEMDLLGIRFAVSADIRLESVSHLAEDWTTIALRLLSAGRLAYDGPVDSTLPRLLAHCRNGLAPADFLPELAAGSSVGDVAPRLAVIVRELIRHGILLPPQT